jgi:hypothetical protein
VQTEHFQERRLFLFTMFASADAAAFIFAPVKAQDFYDTARPRGAYNWNISSSLSRQVVYSQNTAQMLDL